MSRAADGDRWWSCVTVGASTMQNGFLWQALLSAVVGIVVAGRAEAQAGNPALGVEPQSATVLELFTSQGCSSCPAADVLFRSLASRPGVIALSYSVDYWDYLGWKDTFASPKFTDRQRVYGRNVSNGQVYTPQMVINGNSHAVGSSQRDIDTAIAVGRQAKSPAFMVEAVQTDGSISLRAATGASTALGRILLVTVRGPQTLAVKRGENSGRTLTYVNVVRDLTEVGGWTGGSAIIKVPNGAGALAPGERYAILIQAADQGSLLGAGWVK
jgi:hypothetical protein